MIKNLELLAVTLTVWMSATWAYADPTDVKIRGISTSAASELFWILENAGINEIQSPEGETLQGDLLSASVTYLNGAVYQADFSIDHDSTYGFLPNRCAPTNGSPTDACENSSAHLILGGSVAQELFGDMEKAGDPETHGVDVISVQGTDVVCSFAASGAHFSCAITLSSVNTFTSSKTQRAPE